MTPRSPLKSKPLRNPGQSLDEELQRVLDDQVTPYFWFAAVLCLLAALEWFGYLRNAPRQPIVFTAIAGAAVTFVGFRLWQIRKRVQRLKLGRDGERAVGQFLERLRAGGATVYHDVPGDGFNLDHVVIAPQGIFVIETKTWSKPSPNAKIGFAGDSILVNGRLPERDPVRQVKGEASWLRRMLEESTGKQLPVRGVIVFPGWFVDPMPSEMKKELWVLEPKALPSFIEQEDRVLPDFDVALAAYHLGRYVRTVE